MSKTNSVVLDPVGVDLDVSRISTGSHNSRNTVTLGGSKYDYGSKIGSSGLFVIGDPVGSRPTSKAPSITSSYTDVSRNSLHPMINRGYNFEDWNWSAIRFGILILVFGAIAALIAATIGVIVDSRSHCKMDWTWHKGSVIYHISVPQFSKYTGEAFGSLKGIIERTDYLRYLGANVVCLSNFLPSVAPHFDLPTSFRNIDSRVGTMDDFLELVKELHYWDMKVMIEISPVYTSKEHSWYQTSRLQSVNGGNKYTSFYFWEDLEQSQGKWAFDSLRNQYYLYRNESTKPLLDWKNSQLHAEFGEVLEFWLARGVDGFYIKDITVFEDIAPSLVLSMFDSWRKVLDTYSKENDRKALMVSSKLMETVRKTALHLLNPIEETVDLMEWPLEYNPSNITAHIQGQVDSLDMWYRRATRPWVVWNMPNTTLVPLQHLAMMEMLVITFPGTSMIYAGQEVGINPVEGRIESKYLWKSGGAAAATSHPWIPGSIMNLTVIEALKNAIEEKQTELSLRSDTEMIEDETGARRVVTANFIINDGITMLLERQVSGKNSFFISANFGGKTIKHTKWHKYAPGGNAVADTRGRYSGYTQFGEVILDPGQIVVFEVIR